MRRVQKRCRWCERLKPLSCFLKSKRSADGYNQVCRRCKTERERARICYNAGG